MSRIALLASSLFSLTLLDAACPKKATPTTTPTDVPAAAPAAGEPAAEPALPAFTPQAAGARVAILYTASVQGYVTPCGCTGDPLGGVARLSAAVDEARAAYGERVVFLDAGDLLFEKPDDNLAADACQTAARHDLLVDTYARKGLAATTLGPLDDVRGAPWRDERLARRGIPTVLSFGLPRPLEGGAELKAQLLVDAGGVKVGVTGARVDDETALEGARAAVAREASTLRAAGAAAVVLLAQSPRALTRRLGEGLAGVDVIIQGRDPGELPASPERLGEGGPVLVSSGMQAQFLGVLELSLEGRSADAPLALDTRMGAAEQRARLLDTRIAQYERNLAETEGSRRAFLENKLHAARTERAQVFVDALSAPPPAGAYLTVRSIELTRRRPEEPTAQAALADYEARIPELVSTCEASVTCPEPGPDEPTYVGVEACYNCHQDAVKLWRAALVELPGTDEAGRPVVRKLGHSKAWQTLRDVGKDKDRTCVGCHSVGFNAPGGYCRVSDVDFRTDVQCEACHGPGSKHIQNGGDKSSLTVLEVKEATCRGCHHVPHIPTTESFVFEDRLKIILGPGHGQRFLDALDASR